MKMGFLLIAAGILLTASGIVIIIRQSYPDNNKESIKIPEAEHVAVASVTPPKETIHYNEIKSPEVKMPEVNRQNSKPKKKDTAQKSAKQKGNDFENYVVSILRTGNVRFKEWNQGAEENSGVIADNILHPDFRIELTTDRGTLDFWLESKWRRAIGDSFSLPDYQFNRYRDIQKESHRKIILIIGEGGTPSAPAKVFAIPLDSVKSGRISRASLEGFALNNPRAELLPYISGWFYNDVFKRKYR